MKLYIKPELIVEGIATMQMIAESELDVNTTPTDPKTGTMLSKEGPFDIWDTSEDEDY